MACSGRRGGGHGWTCGDVELDGGVRLHYYRTGGGKAALVLAHGITGNSYSWRNVTPRLAAEYDVLMYDARGHGLSSAPKEGDGYEGMADDLAGLIGALKLGRVPVIGHSMGAVTAAVFAGDHPGLVTRVVLEDPPWRPRNRTMAQREAAAESWRKSVARMQAITREERIGQLKRLRPSWTEEQWASCADSERQVDLGVFDLVKSGGPAWRQVVRKVRCPILLLTGDPRAGAIVKPEVAREATGLCSDLRVAHIAGAGHNIHAEHAAEFGVAVARFLNEDADSVGSS